MTPDELFLTVGEEQGIVVSFKAWGAKKYKARYTQYSVLQNCSNTGVFVPQCQFFFVFQPSHNLGAAIRAPV